jgi:alpha-1,3-rhamnosyl/mannosyltransferase
MKILYDYRLIQRFFPRGVSKFGIALLKNLLKINNNDQYNDTITLLVEPELPRRFIKQENSLKCVTINDLNRDSSCFDIFLNTSTVVLSLPSIETIDYLYPEFIIMTCKKIACVLFDFVPLLIRHYIPDDISKINYTLQLEAIKRCDYIFTDSVYTAKSGSVYLGLPFERFTVIYGAIDEAYFSGNGQMEYIASQRNNNVVSVLGWCPRKNAERMVKAWCIAKRKQAVPQNACLYILSCFHGKEILHNICRENQVPISSVEVLDYIPDDELISLISKSRASIFPPYLEGLGLPILESYAAGTPCFASNTSSTKELVSAESAFNPFDENAIADTFKKIYADESLCKRNLEHGRTLLKTINGENVARRVLEKLHD